MDKKPHLKLSRRRALASPLMLLALILLVSAPAGAVRGVPRAKASPRKILGKQVWRLLHKHREIEVFRVARSPGQKFMGHQGIKATATARPGRAWARRLARLLRRPGSYFVPRCDRDGRCPRLRCKTTPRAVVALKGSEASSVLVITTCNALMVGPSLGELGEQVSMEPAEGKLLKLLLKLFPGDAELAEDLAEWRKLR